MHKYHKYMKGRCIHLSMPLIFLAPVYQGIWII